MKSLRKMSLTGGGRRRSTSSSSSSGAPAEGAVDLQADAIRRAETEGVVDVQADAARRMAARASAAEEQRSARAATTIGRHTRGTLVRQRSAYLAVEVAPLVRRMVAPPVALVVWDFDRTVLRVHAFKRGVAAADVPSRWARDVADAELFKATVAAARARGLPVAIASFGHKDVILAYLACIFGGDGDLSLIHI